METLIAMGVEAVVALSVGVAWLRAKGREKESNRRGEGLHAGLISLAQQHELERIEREEQARIERERIERERLEQERTEQERLQRLTITHQYELEHLGRQRLKAYLAAKGAKRGS